MSKWHTTRLKNMSFWKETCQGQALQQAWSPPCGLLNKTQCSLFAICMHGYCRVDQSESLNSSPVSECVCTMSGFVYVWLQAWSQSQTNFIMIFLHLQFTPGVVVQQFWKQTLVNFGGFFFIWNLTGLSVKFNPSTSYCTFQWTDQCFYCQ